MKQQIDCLESKSPNYRKANDSEICTNCKFGQPSSGLFCELFDCVYTAGFVCDAWEAIEVIEQKSPHGFLIFRGKKRAIASVEPYSSGTPLLLTEEGKAYGMVTLEQPAAMSISYFEKSEAFNIHRVNPEERKQWWPKAKSLYVQRISKFRPFVSSVPVEIENGGVIFKEHQPKADEEGELIRSVGRLPKRIVLCKDALCLTGSKLYADCPDDFLTLDLGHSRSLNFLKGFIDKKLGIELKNVLGIEPTYTSKTAGDVLPLYELVLVRKKPQINKGVGTPDFEYMRGGIRRKDKIEEAKQMPFEIQEKEDMVCVVRADTGDEIQCYSGSSAMEQAQNLLVALKINVEADESQIEEEIIEEDEAQFTETDWDGSAARWDTAEAYCKDTLIDVNMAGEDKTKALCFLPFRDPGTQNPNKNALQAIGGGRGITAVEKPSEVDSEKWMAQLEAAANKLIGWWPEAFDKPAPESIFKIVGKERPKEKGEKAGRRIKASMRQRLKDAIATLKDMLSWSSYEDEDKNMKFAEFIKGNAKRDGFAIKMINGEPWHLSWSTNAFEDRQKEIFTTKALENYVSEAEKKSDRGYFNFWHIPGTDFAKKEFQAVLGRFLFEAGPYLDNHQGKSALKFFSEYSEGHPEIAPEGFGASPEFRYLPEEREEGVFNWLWITRTSTLPKAAAANIWTEAKQEDQMALSDQQKNAAVALFGEDFVKENLVEAGDKKTEALEEAGVAHKSNGVEKFVTAIKKVAEKVEDEENKDKILEATKELSAENLAERGQLVLHIADTMGEMKGDLKAIGEEMVGEMEEEMTEEAANTDEEKKEPINIDAIAKMASKQLAIDLKPFAEAMTVLAVKQAEALEEQKAYNDRLGKVEKQLALQSETQVPRYVHSILEKASASAKTVVTEDDPLLKSKPEETAKRKGDGTMADHYFPQPK